MRKRLAAMVGVSVMMLAGPANATVLAPPIAPLVDGDRVDSGCTVIPITGEPTHAPPRVFEGSPGWIDIGASMTCTHGWRASRVEYSLQVLSDTGGRMGVRSRALGGAYEAMPDDATPSPEPVGKAALATVNPCLFRTDYSLRKPGTAGSDGGPVAWLLPRGEHQLIIHAYAKVNEYKSDLHLYDAHAEQVFTTVSCGKWRRAYR